MVTTTTVYGFQKPAVAGDEDAWGGYLNNNIDKYESILTGNTTITSLVITTADINGGTLDNVVIGGSTAAAVTGTTITGTSFVSTGNMTFGDNNKALFGAGSDLEVYHNGTNSVIYDNGTGNLQLVSGGASVDIIKAGGENMATFATDGAATLYYDNSAKIATTSTGIDVTGNIVVSGTVDGRDVATDGTKLDGIETGATADQTKTDIDALNINADTVDSLHASSFLRSDANDTATGTITLAAANFAEQLEINRSAGAYYSVIKYSNTAGELGKLGFTQNSDLIVRLGTSGTDNTIWHSGNDGSGSGLDADTLDGVQGSSYLRSDANDTTTGMLTVDNDSGVKVVYGVETTNVYYTGYGIDSQRGTTYIRPTANDNTQTLYVGGSGSANDWNTIAMKVGNDDNVTINDNTVFHQANLIEGTTFSGTYPVLFNVDASTGRIFSNANITFNGSTATLDVNGNMTATNMYVASNIYHEGDTDTYVNFENDFIRIYTGGSYTQFTASGPFINDGSLAEDYDALSGTTPTCNVDTGGMFSLTMTGNTTFTFSGAASGYAQGFILELTGNGGTVDFTTNQTVKFAGGTAPDAPASGETDIYTFVTRDGGSTWYGTLVIDAAS